MEIGRINELKAARTVEFGLFLEDADGKEVLLPRRYVPENVEMGDAFEAFVYKDSENRLTATLETPAAVLEECAYLRCESVSSAGAFLGWGLPKDLFVPFAEQNGRMQPEESYVVRICLDEQTDRLYGSMMLDDFLCEFAEGYEPNDEVDLLVADKTDLGFKVIVDEGCWGLVYKEEVFSEIEIGQRLTGYVKALRNDARLDIGLQKAGYDKIDAVESLILKALNENDGYLPLGNKTPAQEIYDTFGISKKAFKLGMSGLYRKRIITIKDGLRLVDGADGDTSNAEVRKAEASAPESAPDEPVAPTGDVWAKAKKALEEK